MWLSYTIESLTDIKLTLYHRLHYENMTMRFLEFSEAVKILKIFVVVIVLYLARLYESTGRAIAVTPASVSASALALLKC